MKRLDIPTGTRFGRLVIQSEVTVVGRPRRFACRCECGARVEVALTHLRSGHTKSCGCVKIGHRAVCEVEACGRPASRKGLCNAHGLRKRQGSVLPDSAPVRVLDPTGAQRLSERVEKNGECMLWQGALNYAGYGHLRVGGRLTGVHRIAYELAVGPIPAGLEIDHLCAVRNCVNPAHLEPVTHEENLRRARERSAG